MSKFTLRSDLVTTQVGDETLILIPETKEVHCLNTVAAGHFRTLQEGGELPSTPEASEALQLFEKYGFTEGNPVDAKVHRREALSMLGKAALVPAVLTVALPQPASAMSAGVMESDCILGVAGTCGQPCIDVIGSRICGALSVGGPCACLAAGSMPVCGCSGS
jgi:hypothetical protein